MWVRYVSSHTTRASSEGGVLRENNQLYIQLFRPVSQPPDKRLIIGQTKIQVRNSRYISHSEVLSEVNRVQGGTAVVASFHDWESGLEPKLSEVKCV